LITTSVVDESRLVRAEGQFEKMTRPSSTAATIDAKLSSANTMSAASLETSVPVIPIAIPMFCGFQGGRVVDAVAGHGHDCTPALQGFHDTQLVLGIDTRVDRELHDSSLEDVVIHRVQLCAGDGTILVCDSELYVEAAIH
jgi:hypothetical protein